MCFWFEGITCEVLIRDQDLVMLGFDEDAVMLGFGEASCSSLRFGVFVTWVCSVRICSLLMVLRLRYACAVNWISVVEELNRI